MFVFSVSLVYGAPLAVLLTYALPTPLSMLYHFGQAGLESYPSSSLCVNGRRKKWSTTVGGRVAGIMDRYAKFVRSNEDAVRLLESVLQTIVFFLPSRYIDHGGAEVWAEAGYSASNLLGVLHDHLLNGQYPVNHAVPPTWARNSIAASMTIAGDTSPLHSTRQGRKS